MEIFFVVILDRNFDADEKAMVDVRDDEERHKARVKAIVNGRHPVAKADVPRTIVRRLQIFLKPITL